MGLNPTGKPRAEPIGQPEIAEGCGGDKQRAIRRQNEAARVLAWRGYKVQHQPKISAEDRLSENKDPDYRMEGRIFDCYAPIDTLPRNPLIFQAVNGTAGRGREMKQIISLYTLARMEQTEAGSFDEFDDDVSNTSVAARYAEARMDYALAKVHAYARDKVKALQTRNIVLNLADSPCPMELVKRYFVQNPIENLKHLVLLRPKGDALPTETYNLAERSYSVYGPEDWLLDRMEFEAPLDPTSKPSPGDDGDAAGTGAGAAAPTEPGDDA